MPIYQLLPPLRGAREELIIAYEQLSPIFYTWQTELKELAAKRPEMILTPAQVRMLNRVLKSLRRHFKNEPEGRYLRSLPAHQPKIGDAILLMSQYEAVLDHFSRRYCYLNRTALRLEWLVEKANGKQPICRPFNADSAPNR